MIDELSVRIGQEKDTDALAHFNMALAWETERKRLSSSVVTKGIQTLLKNPQYGFYVVAEKPSGIVGSLMITFEWSDWRCGLFWWIQSVYVKPEFRQRGVFRQLYEYLKDKALRESNVCGFRLYVKQSNLTALNTYSKVGMKETPYKVCEDLPDGQARPTEASGGRTSG